MDNPWHALDAHRPLDPGDARYVAPPESAGQRIADLVRAGQHTLLVVGPVGVGKSTELARGADLLAPDRVVALLQLDRLENMRKLTEERVALRIAAAVAVAVDARGQTVSDDLVHVLDARGVLSIGSLRHATPTSDIGWGPVDEHTPTEPGPTMIAVLMDAARVGRVTLLVDGVEKCPPDAAEQVFSVLEEIPEDVDVVCVIPWHAAYGPRSAQVLREGERTVPVRPLDLDPAAGEATLRFCGEVLARKAGRALGPPFVEAFRAGTIHRVLGKAAAMSGGILRTLLQLLADAGTRSALRGGPPWPEERDLDAAIADQRDAFRRLLLPGDTDAIRAVIGTDGRELPLDRKIRLLAHGVVLERLEAGEPVLRPHPLVAPLLSPAHA